MNTSILDSEIDDYFAEMLQKSILGRLGEFFPDAITLEENILTNKSDLITSVEIEKVLDLLHSDYKKLGVAISIHKSRAQTLLKCMNPFTSTEMRKSLLRASKKDSRMLGLYGRKRIVIFPYNHKTGYSGEHESSCWKLMIIETLIHEIRHAYQEKHKTKRYSASNDSYIPSGKGYDSQWTERDANLFAQRMMNKNKQEINRILGIGFDWECIWGSFSVNF